FLGLMALPFIWVMTLGLLYADFSSNEIVRSVVTGVGVAGAGLLIGTAIKLGRALVKKPAALALLAGCFLSVGIGRLSMYLVLPVALVLALVAARRGWL